MVETDSLAVMVVKNQAQHAGISFRALYADSVIVNDR